MVECLLQLKINCYQSVITSEEKASRIPINKDFQGFLSHSHSVFNVKCIKQNAILSRELKQYTEQ